MAAGYLSSLNGQAMSTHGLNASNSLSASTPLSSKAPICWKYLSKKGNQSTVVYCKTTHDFKPFKLIILPLKSYKYFIPKLKSVQT